MVQIAPLNRTPVTEGFGLVLLQKCLHDILLGVFGLHILALSDLLFVLLLVFLVQLMLVFVQVNYHLHLAHANHVKFVGYVALLEDCMALRTEFVAHILFWHTQIKEYNFSKS